MTHRRFLRPLLFVAALAISFALQAQIVVEEVPEPVAAPTTPRPSRVNILGPTEICKGNETTLKVEGEYESYEWSTGSTERYIKVREEGVYEVTVRTKGGCQFTTSVNVRVRPCS